MRPPRVTGRIQDSDLPRHAVVVVVIALMAATAFALPPIPQDPLYHRFADRRTVFAIPNAWNVLSNLAIGIGGGLGLRAVFGSATFRRTRENAPARRAYAALFIGVVLTAIGSMYYHLAPDNARLVWDRLPVALGFMALMAAMVAERASMGAASALLLPLLLFGAGSVIYWHVTETAGAGDLRWYALVQFGTLPAILLLIALYPSPALGTRYALAAIAAYAAAKAFELADVPIFSLGHVVSGHTLKHLAAGIGVSFFAAMISAREDPEASPRRGAR